MNETETRFGAVAVVGRPNVGKSTLVNRLLGERLCITANRPQTTRHQILGVVTNGPVQMALVDTPGMHGRQKRQLNRVLNRSAGASLTGVDLALFVVAACRWTDDDELVRDRLIEAGIPVIGVVNRVDQLRRREELLPFLDEFGKRLQMDAIVPISAKTGDNLEALRGEIERLLPPGEHAFDPDTLTDRSERFLAGELVREQLVRQLGDELPYSLTVEIEQFELEEPGNRVRIAASIWVERDSQKAIVIGRGGTRLKAVGTEARRHICDLLGRPVHLDLWVKVRSGWADDARALRQLGYDTE